jgi:ABC-type antimicrobial peptide transport system permease subunit
MAYAVAQRTRELGIRAAIGANRGDLVWLVAKQAASLTGTGLLVGIGAALLLSKGLRSLLYEVEPADPFTFVVVPVTLAVVALLATWLPARRASRADPLTAIRAE